ncbi:hypothetical protein RAS1_00320 [Phycisphaerae bacterium RAS1]|nr:hypothetical protein RAS1_00320 [Phycisphaerae bacterium RAS1]
MPEPPSPDPAAPHPAAGRSAPKPGRHPLNWSLHGLPEYDLFETPQQRERALSEIARFFSNPLKLDFWIGVLLLAGIAFGAVFFARALLRLVVWPAWIEEVLRLAFLAVVTLAAIRFLHRWGARADLRRKLREYGIPVCLKCGYDLRGQVEQSPRCPECGEPLDAAVREILQSRGQPR